MICSVRVKKEEGVPCSDGKEYQQFFNLNPHMSSKLSFKMGMSMSQFVFAKRVYVIRKSYEDKLKQVWNPPFQSFLPL